MILEKRRREWSQKCRDSFWYFLTSVISWKKGVFYEPLHRPLAEFLEDEEDRLVLISRGCFKSTITTVAYPLWLAIKYPNVRILIVSDVMEQPKKWLKEQKWHMREDPIFRWLFPEIVPEDGSKKFGTWKEWNVLNRVAGWEESTVTIASTGTEVTGQHYEVIVCDDLVGKTNSMTKNGLDSIKSWWAEAAPLLEPPKTHSFPTPNPHFLIVGTRWDFNDLYSKLLPQGDYEVGENGIIEGGVMTAMVRPAVEKGKLIFPTVLTDDELDKQLKRQGSTSFSAQYLLKPVSDEDALFHKHNTRYFTPEEIENKPLHTRISIDLAVSEKQSADDSVVMCTGTDPDGNLYVLEYWAGKASATIIMGHIMRMYQKYNCANILVEVDGQQGFFKQHLADWSRRFNFNPPVVPIRNDSSKKRRAYTLQPFHENGRLRIRTNMEALELQLYNFGKVEHEDIVDALSMVTASGHAWADPELMKTPAGTWAEAMETIDDGFDDVESIGGKEDDDFSFMGW